MVKDDLPAPSGARNAEADFPGTTPTDATHASTTDPEAKLYLKGRPWRRASHSSAKR